MDTTRRGRVRGCPVPAVVALVVTIVAIGAVRPVGASEPPVEWDTRLVPVVHEVERIRGLTFEHAVDIEFLSDAAFAQRVGIDRGELTASDEKQMDRSEAMLRAAGLVAGDVDLVSSLSDLQESGVLAYYEPDTERITVRGKTLDVATRVTLAHELTHALQDQHFDLDRIQRRADRVNGSAAARALIEGDAKRVEIAYLDTLPGPERDEYVQWQQSAGSRVTETLDAAGVPAALVAVFQSPYSLGQEMLRVLVAAQDEHAVDALFADPPVSDVSYLDPRTLLADRHVRDVKRPTLGPGERRLGRRGDVFGAFALYLVLATSGDAVGALRVADGWGGDALVTFTHDGTTCIRANFVGVDAGASAAIGDALASWSASRGAGVAEAATMGDVTTLTACDQGSTTADPGRTPQAALVTVLLRNTLLAQGAELVGVDSASCAVDRTLGDASFGPVVDAAVADPSAPLPDAVSAPFTRAVTAALVECRTG